MPMALSLFPFIMNVMLNVEELIIHLEKKITEYRYHQKRTQKARGDIRQARDLLLSLRTTLHAELAHAFEVYRSQMAGEVVAMGECLSGVVGRVRREREEEVLQLRGEIERQHKVISAMRKEVEDLQELMIMQGAVAEREHSPINISSQSPNQQRTPNKQRLQVENASPPRTFGGLQMIEEQTERTLMSSARSGQEQRCLTDCFIRIEQQEEFQSEPSHFLKHPQEFKLASCDRPQRSHSSASSQHSEWPSQEQGALSKLEQMMELSHFSQRVHSLGEESFPQYQSLPISMGEGEYPRAEQECLTWAGTALKDISNEGEQEHERQSRSKMFLEEFRRTFNKCLSSSGTSRKNSAKLDQSSRPAKSTREGGQGQNQQGPVGSKESQRMISEMLQNMDNNNKFFVGSRKLQLRYEGGRKGGSREGQGTLYYSNGFSYEGEFRNNLRHGYGILRYNQTEVYRGEWQADELNGQGKIRNATAVNRKKGQSQSHQQGQPSSPLVRWVSYCGYFRSNRFEGQGTLYLQGGEKFLGRFICGSACGEGTLYRKNGQVETGIWRNNQLVEAF